MGCNCASVPVMARNAVGAAVRVASALAEGRQVAATPAKFEGRMGQCRARVGDCCVEVVKNGTTYHRCKVCGCWLDGKFLAKAAVETEQCPRGYWT